MRKQILMVLLLLCAAAAEDQTQQGPPPIDWQDGPTTGKLGNVAEIEVPEGFRFTDGAGTRKLLELTQNPTNGREVGALIPNLPENSNEKMYFIIFEYEATGYVSDADKDKLDAAALLESIQNGTEEANKERAKRGWEPFHVLGWAKAPFYDPATNNLTWAIRGKGNTSESINYSTRILGRRGTMSVDLVASPAQYENLVPAFNQLIAGYQYTDGNRYSQFVKGDKIAEYGLAALVAGGAGAAAAKLGLFGKLAQFLGKAWKLVVLAFVGLIGALKKLFGKKEQFPVEQAEQAKPAAAGE